MANQPVAVSSTPHPLTPRAVCWLLPLQAYALGSVFKLGLHDAFTATSLPSSASVRVAAVQCRVVWCSGCV